MGINIERVSVRCRLRPDMVCFGHNVDSLFFKQEMELSLIGLQNAGKTSLVNVIAVSVLISFQFLFTLFLSRRAHAISVRSNMRSAGYVMCGHC